MVSVATQRRRPAALRSWPLASPGMPPPGPDFLKAALLLHGDDLSRVEKGKAPGRADDRNVVGPAVQALYDRALRQAGFSLQVAVKGASETVRFVPGHVWGQHREAFARSLSDPYAEVPLVDGPRPCRVMVVGKNPGKEEESLLRNWVGPSGQEFTAAVERARLGDADGWYVTNVCKFCPPFGIRDLASGWLADCLPLLHMELRLVRPELILCLGADALKALLGKSTTLRSVEGRVVEWSFPVGRAYGSDDRHHCLLAAAIHPAQAMREEADRRTLDRGLERFRLLCAGVRYDKAEPDVDHRVVDTFEDALGWANEAAADLAGLPPRLRLVAWDAEWHGRSPGDRKSYLRTVQVSWADKKAVVFRLRRAGGGPCFVDAKGRGAQKRLFRLLRDFCRRTACRSVGHFLNADLEWLGAKAGFDPTEFCRVPLYDADDGTPAWKLLRDGNGRLDTALMAHAVEETALLGLETLANRYTSAPRYELRLDAWKKEFCAARGVKAGHLDGFGECPEEVLVGVEKGPAAGWGTRLSSAEGEQSYAAYDADATRRLCVALLPLLDRDYQRNNCWEPCWESMITQPVILEMKRNGILVDRDRLEDLTATFNAAAENQLAKLRKWARWPELNPRSHFQVRELLFGERLNGKPHAGGAPVVLRPKKARVVGAAPLFDTGKPPRAWADVVAAGLELHSTASTGKATLNILCAEAAPEIVEGVKLVRDFRFLDQVCKGVLRNPLLVDDEDPASEWLVDDETGEPVYDGGVAAAICHDGRVRTTLLPTAETGRWKSRNPNLQNISKSRDDDYVRLLGEAYDHKLRSMFVPSPGHALIEFDYTGAELAVAAFMSADPRMIEHVLRMAKPEHDPDHYDIHANIAARVFNLLDRLAGLPLTKGGFKKAGLSKFRVLAKNVIFGLFYGRSAKAIAVQARESRRPGEPEFTVDMAQAIIDEVFDTYPGLLPLFNGAAAIPSTTRCGRHAYGRWRRVPEARDRTTLGEQERQMKNFYIQGPVASMVDRGLAYLQDARDRVVGDPGLFRALLQIHDAGLVEAPYANVDYLAAPRGLIERCMCDAVPFWPTDLAGRPLGVGPYHLQLEISVMPAWGESYTKAEAARLGFSTDFASAA